MDDLIGRVFDRKYQLTRLLGEGGMGAVYEGEHTIIHRKVAVKVLHSEFSTSQDVVNRFVREAQAASAIGHPNIVEIHDVGREEDGTVFIVMELISGESLKEIVKREGKLPPDRVVFIVLQVLSALSAAHEKGIVHRDMKPDNVVMTVSDKGSQEVKLLDFGIAKIEGVMDGDQGITQPGTVLGTPNYMSPEQARGKEIDHRVDIWSVGVMMYEMLSGRLPFFGNNYNEVLGGILLETPPALQNIAPGIPAGLAAVVEKAMAKNRDQRFLNAGEMIQALSPFSKGAKAKMTASSQEALKKSSIAPPPYASQFGLELEIEPEYDAKPKQPQRKKEAKEDRISLQPIVESYRQWEVAPLDSRSRPDSFGRRTAPSSFARATDATPFDLAHVRQGTRQKKRSKLPAVVGFLITVGVIAALVVTVKPVREKYDTLYDKGIRAIEQVMAYWKPMSISDDETMVGAAAEKAGINTYGVDPANEGDSPNGTQTADAGPVEKEKPDEKKKISKEVTIELKGLPDNARITVDERSETLPISLRRSLSPRTLRITAPGYIPFEQTILPYSDQTIEINMQQKPGWKPGKRK
jgi:serine/threonine protein kinase